MWKCCSTICFPLRFCLSDGRTYILTSLPWAVVVYLRWEKHPYSLCVPSCLHVPVMNAPHTLPGDAPVRQGFAPVFLSITRWCCSIHHASCTNPGKDKRQGAPKAGSIQAIALAILDNVPFKTVGCCLSALPQGKVLDLFLGSGPVQKLVSAASQALQRVLCPSHAPFSPHGAYRASHPRCPCKEGWHSLVDIS